MNEQKMLEAIKDIRKDIMIKSYCSGIEKMDELIRDLKKDIAIQNVEKSTDKQALRLIQRLMSKKKGWKYQKYLHIEDDRMYWTNAYVAFELKYDDSWVECLEVYKEEGYPNIKALFRNNEIVGDHVSLTLTKCDVVYWRKTIDKEDGVQIIRTVCHDTEGNEFNCAFDVKNLEDLFIILRADELTLKAKKKTCAGNNIVNSFVTENEYGKGIVVSVRSFEGGEKNE